MRTLASSTVKNKTVALRVDLNVPIQKQLILDDTRIISILPTIQYLLTENAKVILISHLGRPYAGHFDPQFSLDPVARKLSELLEIEVPLISSIVDAKFETPISLLENTRFLVGELENDLDLANSLGNIAEVYVFDAFGTSHREQASTYGAINHADISCAGLLLEKEIAALSSAISSINAPLLSIIGGSKVSSKLGVIKNLSLLSENIITGGGITNTFLKASGLNIGSSLYEESMLSEARDLLSSTNIYLPNQVVVSSNIDSLESRVCDVRDVQDNEMILDQVLDEQAFNLISQAKQIIWNGPIGVFERDAFAQGTQQLAEAIAQSSAFSLAGGGETLLAIKMFINKSDISYCSTGGGAFLEFMEGKELPSLSALGFTK
ncbi:phosphoglycerate kinase [Gammaproteobacteria bacterium]|nr:phosphoglycerate kinase [bacterium]MDA9154361.1 phosphoglycerate kinase [Gammaproteobacteria bacterium]MDA9340707.1 phosphoglycerate kinase [Gammaproteobacteria bacterium]MDB9790305.1 phosphoglycerate kinase [Gammaproteobacteria bacterium]|tara:strand:+ start:2360 stop:3496 length:1137 start_codon:yes stop_codon:yes gene_type:complete